MFCHGKLLLKETMPNAIKNNTEKHFLLLSKDTKNDSSIVSQLNINLKEFD